MFGTTGAASSFLSPPGGSVSFSSPQPQPPPFGSSILSPNTSNYVGGLMSMQSPIHPPVGSGSPVFQSPTSNKFPAGGGNVVFTPHSNVSPMTGQPSASVLPYSYMGGAASSFVQSPPGGTAAGGGPGGVAMVFSPPPYSSTFMGNPPHPNAASPVVHGYSQQLQYSAVQPYGYPGRAMTGVSNSFHHHQSHVQYNYPTSPYFGHNSPRDETTEPMHCSPINLQHPSGAPQYQQLHRSPPGANPLRPLHLPAFFTGVDHNAPSSSGSRPRRVFDRSPSTSPPAQGLSGGRSPQKSPSGWGQQETGQSGGGGQMGSEGMNPLGGMFRATGTGPSRQLKFNETQQSQAAEEKDKAKRVGPPIHGFGSSEEVSNFLSSPLLDENNVIIPGAAIAHEAVLKAGSEAPTADSNWITVFGFPAAAASFIYTHFSQYGSILQSKCNPGGNWLHIKYASRIDARRALACNGKVLGGSIMVGVITSPKEVIEIYDKSYLRDLTTASSPNQQKPGGVSSKGPLQERNSEAKSGQVSSRSRTIRPLAGSSQLTSPVLGGGGGGDKVMYGSPSGKESTSSFLTSPSRQNENVPMPTASTGILTKAMEYMFGW